MHVSLLVSTALVSVACAAPLINTTTTTLATRDMQPWYTFTGGRIPDARQFKAAPKQWKDPYGVVSMGSFSVEIENGQANVFAQAIGPLAPPTGHFATSFQLCKPNVPTTTQHGTSGWIDVHAVSLVFFDLFVHTGNQCTFKLPGEQFDNTWLFFRGNFVNLPNDSRCAFVYSYLPGIVRARRCILRL